MNAVVKHSFKNFGAVVARTKFCLANHGMHFIEYRGDGELFEYVFHKSFEGRLRRISWEQLLCQLV